MLVSHSLFFVESRIVFILMMNQVVRRVSSVLLFLALLPHYIYAAEPAGSAVESKNVTVFLAPQKDVSLPLLVRPKSAVGALLPKEIRTFLIEELIPREAFYFKPGVGIDSATGMPYDHIRYRLKRNILGEVGNYTAASKLSLSISYLLGVIKGRDYFASAPLSPPEARTALRKTLKTILRYTKEFKDYGGFLPWVDIRPDGTIAPATLKVPALDNGQMTWTLAAVIAAFEHSDVRQEKELYALAGAILKKQNYRRFYDVKKGLLHGSIQKNPLTNVWTQDKTYYLNDMFEGVLAVLWGVLNGQIPEAAWDNLNIPTVDYKTEHKEKVTTFLGFRASFHEHWALIFLPLMETPLSILYYNYLYAQADYARRNHLPGFLSTGYDSNGNYKQMGIPELAAQPVDRHDVSVVFATAMGLLISKPVAAAWLKNIYYFGNVLTSFGAVESVAPDGYADIFTADAKGLTVLSASEGVTNEVKQYLMTHQVPGTKVSMYEKFLQLVNKKYSQMIIARGGIVPYVPAKPFPLPPEKSIRVHDQIPGATANAFSITRHLQPGHLHGKNVTSLDSFTLEDDVKPLESFAFQYEIPAHYTYFDQWAYRGTYVDQAVPIADMRYLSIVVPADAATNFMEIEIKSDDINLAAVSFGTDEAQYISQDEKWKVIVKNINPIPDAKYKLFNYFSVVKPDPRYLSAKYARSGREGAIFIKNIVLTKHHPFLTEPGQNLPASDEATFEGLPYWRLSHGDLNYVCDPLSYACSFSGQQGWRGGYLPYVDLSKYNYMYIKLKNLLPIKNTLRLDLKYESTFLLGEKGIKIEMPRSNESFVYEVILPDSIKDGTANYFAIAEPRGDFVVESILFSKAPLEDKHVKKVEYISSLNRISSN